MLYFANRSEICLIQNARISPDGRSLSDVVVKNGVIHAIFPAGEIREKADRVFDAEGKLLLPGLVEVHCHGCMGMETADGPEAQVKMSEYWAEEGVTSWYPTGTTIAVSHLRRVFAKIPETPTGANIVGYHSEGPYINDKYRGAQDPNYIVPPSLADFDDLGTVKLITLAPEVEGGLEFIKKTNILPVLGHTDADYDTALAAFRNGAKCVTHLFNAMPPLHHRNPSVLGAAYDGDAYVQLISDGVHIHPSVVRMTYRLFGAERMILISDAVRPALLPDGDYTNLSSGGMEVVVKNGEARLKNGVLAGSTSSLYTCVQRAISFGIPPIDAYRMASETPARMMGLRKGKIQKGYDAEFLFVDSEWKKTDVLILNK